MKRLLFFLLAIIFAIQVFAQNVQIGSGTSTQNYIPINAYYGYSYSQQIIKSSEISASGLVTTGGSISKISYYWNGTGGFNKSTQWKIYLGHTTKTSFVSTTDWAPVSGLSLVFDTLITPPTSAGWFTINLQTPFLYNGTDNLIVAVDENMPSYSSTSTNFYSYNSSDCGLYYYNDGINPDPTSPPTGTKVNNVPQIKLYFLQPCGVASPENPSILALNSSEATINWIVSGLETQWNIQYKLKSDVSWTSISSINKPYQITGLIPNSNYQLQVQANCGSSVVSGWSDTLLFTTPAIPTQLPFLSNFENDGDNINWQFINGTQVNKWYVGQAKDLLTGLSVDTLGFTKSLYIAGNATGDTNMYLGGSSANVSRVYAFRDFFIPSGTAEVNLEFDWRANGNNATSDFLRVYLVPTTATITAGAIPPGGLDASAQIGNYIGGVGEHWLSKKTTWQHAKFRITETQFPLLANNTWRLLVHWRNENTAGTAQPPAAVDNMSINVITCPAPITLVASNPTVNSVNLSWVEKGTATAWNVYYKNINSSVWSMATATSNPYTLSGLNSSSTYQVKIQASCATDTSYMTGIVNFNTVCAQISTFPWKEGFENTWATALAPGNASIPGNCWLNINGGTSTSYLWQKSTSLGIPEYQRTGTGSAQLLGLNESMGDYLITPIFTFTGNEKINFYAKGYTITPALENVWVKAYDVSTNGDVDSYSDTTLMTNIGFISDTNQNAWKEYEFTLTNLIGNYRLVFARNNNVGYNFYIDDIEIDYQGSCPRPTIVSVANIQTTQADIAWTAGTATDNSWRIFYRPIGTLNWDSVSVTTNPYTLTNLLPNTAYEIEVKTVCSNGGFSDGRASLFRSACLPITSIPHFENFDSYGSGSYSNWQSCWYRFSTYYPTYYPYLSSTNNSSPASMYFYAGSGNAYYNLVASPKIDTTISPINTLKVKFKMRKNSTTIPGVQVGIMSDPKDTSTFIQVGSLIYPTALYVWEDKEVSFATFTGNGSYIAFKCSGATATNYFYIDDIEISQVPSCAKPTAIASTNILTTQADISWLNGQPTDNAWWIYYKPATSGIWDSVSVNTNPYTLLNLTPATNYDLYLKTDCGYGVSEASFFHTFKTSCVPIFSTLLPWTESFEGISAANEIPNCWGATNIGAYTYTQTSNSSYNRVAHSGNKSAFFRYGCNDAFYTPGFDLVAGTTYTFSFWYITDGIYGWTSLKTGVYSAQNSTSFIQNVGTSISNPVNTTYQQYIGTFTPSTNGVYYFGVNCQAAYNTWYLTIDDLKLEIKNCGMPTNITSKNTTSTSFDIVWDAGVSTEWQIEYRASSDTIWTKQHVIVDSLTISGLTPNTNYQVRVAALCNGVIDTSYFTSTTILTTCLPINTLPYLETFDNYGAGSYSNWNYCWYRTSSYYPSSHPYISGTNFSSPGSMYFYVASGVSNYNLVCSPPIDPIIPINTLRVKFKMYNYSTSIPGVTVGVMSNPNDTSTFVQIGSIIGLTAPSTWEDKEVSFASYTGTGTYIAFKCQGISSSYNVFNIDNVEISVIPTCAKPTNLAISNITNTTVEFSWINGNTNNNAWWLFTKLASATTYDSILITSASPYIIQNLLPSCQYNYYMKTDCPTELSEPTQVNSFSTACGVMTIPTPIESFVKMSQNICWSRYTGQLLPIGNSTLTSSTGGWEANTNITPHNTKVNLYTTNQYYWLVTPSIDLAAGSPSNKIEFDVFYTDYGNGDPIETGYSNADKKFYVLISTDDGLTWSVSKTMKKWDNAGSVDTLNKLTNVPLHVTIPIVDTANNPYTGIVKFAFYAESTVSGNGDNDLHIDNFQVTVPICVAPTALTTSGITQTAATVSWTPGASETSWEVKLGVATTVTSPTYTFAGLTAATTYIAYVRANCGGTSNSVWVPITFTTNSAPMITTAPVTTFTYNSAILGGSYIQSIDTVNVIGFEYKVDTATSWTNQAVSPVATPFSYNATGLTPSTLYKVRAYATTNAGTFYGDTASFTTSAFNVPIVTTDSIFVYYGNTTAKLYGSITTGTENIMARGFEYKTSTQTWSQAFELSATGTSSITATATGLVSGANYDVRAYAETQSGKTYGTEKNFVATSGLDNIEAKQIEVTLYPNPANTKTTVCVRGIFERIEMEFVDMLGRTIKRFNLKSSNGEAKQVIEVADLEKGIYYVRIKNNNKTISTQKLIIR